MVKPLKPSDVPNSGLRLKKIQKKSIIKELIQISENAPPKGGPKMDSKLKSPKISAYIKTPMQENSPNPSLRKRDLSPLTATSITPRNNPQKPSVFNLDKNDSKVSKKEKTLLKKQKTRSVLTKNNVPIITKSELQVKDKDKKEKKEPKREKIKNNFQSVPPAEKNFKHEGRTQSILKKNTKEDLTKTVIVIHNEKSPYLKEIHKNAITSQIINQKIQMEKMEKEGKKANFSGNQSKKSKKGSLKRESNLGKPIIEKLNLNLSPRSENEEIDFKNIKHNDSFVISAKKLGSRRGSRRPKPEVIRLYKRKDTTKTPENKKLKSCLKKNPEIRTRASGEGKTIAEPKKTVRRSQIPRLTKEISVVA